MMSQDKNLEHLEKLDHNYNSHHLLLFGDQVKVLPLILTVQHEKKNQYLSHHLKQQQHQEKNHDAWDLGYDKLECIGILHDD